MKKLLSKIFCILCASVFAAGTIALTACDFGKTPDDNTDTKNPGEITNPENPDDKTPDGENPDGENPGDENPDVEEETPVAKSPEEYILHHDEGVKVEYVFEAECTNLENKEGNTYSGDAKGSDMAKSGGTDASNEGVVGYLYNFGNSVNFIIVSDRDVTDATLVLRCGAEFNNTTLNANTLTVRSEPVYDNDKGISSEAFLTHYQEGGAWGKWDELFLDYFKMDFDDLDSYNFNGQYLTSFECGSISIQAAGAMNVTGIDDFTLTLKLKLWKGVNSISIITNNNDIPVNTETQRATAVVIDCIKITTTAQLGMYFPQDNGYGTENACTFKVVED